MKRLQLWIAAVLCCAAATALYGQTPVYYNGTDATGQLVLTRTVNLLQLASAANLQTFGFKAPGAVSTQGFRSFGLVFRGESTPNEGPRHDPPTLPSQFFSLRSWPVGPQPGSSAWSSGWPPPAV